MKSIYPLIRIRTSRGIVAEVVFPLRPSSTVIILAQGLPSSPDKRSLLSFLAGEGFIVVHPRYAGSWDSAGCFAQHSPTRDIEEVIQFLEKRNALVDLWTKEKFLFHAKSFILLGTSFGGPAVLLNSKNKHVKKVIAVSPVLDWSREGEEEPFGKWIAYLEDGYPGAYRVSSKKDWQRFQKKNFYNPVTMLQEIDGSKIFVLHAQDDHVVPVDPVIPFATKIGATYYIKPHGGHSLDIRHRFLWKKIVKFIKKRNT